jgi:hypothetical protein
MIAIRASQTRPLTPGEWRSLSRGLAEALRAAGATPLIVARTHPAARVSALWRGEPPIVARGDSIWWPDAPADFSNPWAREAMAILQHELQHVLDYRLGFLTAARYLSNPRHWTYGWRPEDLGDWDGLGAEQHAAIAERLWRAEAAGLGAEAAALRRAIPWAVAASP